MTTRKEVLIAEYTDIIEEAEAELEIKATEIHAVEFSSSQSLAEWSKNKNLIQAIIKKSEEHWARKKVAMEQLDLVRNQSSLDEYTEEVVEEEGEEGN